jgi:hypothetical protein
MTRVTEDLNVGSSLINMIQTRSMLVCSIEMTNFKWLSMTSRLLVVVN